MGANGNFPTKYRLEDLPEFLRPTAAKAKIERAPSNGIAIAEVDGSDPNTILVREPEQFTLPAQTHEETHVFQFGRNPAVVKEMEENLTSGKLPRTYDYGGIDGLLAARKQGKTIADYGPEQQAQMVSDFQRLTLQAMKNGDPELLDRVNAAYVPFVRQLASLPGRNDPMTSINTTPLPPGLPPSSITGIMEPDDLLGGAARVVLPVIHRMRGTK